MIDYEDYETSPEDTCCACYGCPDHGHDCGLPPIEAAMRRATFMHKEAKAIEMLIVQGHVMACRECGTLFDPRMVFGENCVEHGGVLQGSRHLTGRNPG